MDINGVIEIAIGLVVAWLVLSVATAQIQEWITDKLDRRSIFMEQQLRDMLKNDTMMEKFYQHPLIQSLHMEKTIPLWRIRKPLGQLAEKFKLFSWLGKIVGVVKGKTKTVKPIEISNTAFATAAVDIFLNAGKDTGDVPAGSMSLEQMKQAFKQSTEEIGKMSSDLKRVVTYMEPAIEHMADDVDSAEKAVAKFRSNVETWFDNAMIKATKMYRQNAQYYAFLIGFALAVAFNVDSINIMNALWRDPTLRAAIVAQAPKIDTEPGATVKDTMSELNALALPVGWTTVPCESLPDTEGRIKFNVTNASNSETVECRVVTNVPVWGDWWGYIYKLVGLFVSAAAASQGAPFWFDALKKLLALKQPAKQERKADKE